MAADLPSSAAEPVISQEQINDLAQSAAQARQWAYAPYSSYAVGAALLTASGRVYDGVNVENAAYPATICAERTAVVKAVSEGERQFLAIAVSTANGGSPCGTCRQVLAEFGLNTLVIIAGPDGSIMASWRLRELLPDAFGPGALA
jgi:cytidine deaminase